MLRRLTLLVAGLAVMAGCFGLLTAPAAAYNPFGDACKAKASNDSTGANPVCSAGGGDPLGGKTGVIRKFSLLFSVLAGVVAVIVIIVSGIRFITSRGEAEQVTRAKRTITYAVIGLLAIVLAGTLINFVVGAI